jgi:ABC-type oligopeptide transport system ATPase subunit
MSPEGNGQLLHVTGLKTYFSAAAGLFRRRVVRAVDGVSFALAPGKTLGLVGESGSGKTTVGRTLLRLIPATAGQVIFDGQDVFSLDQDRKSVV